MGIMEFIKQQQILEQPRWDVQHQHEHVERIECLRLEQQEKLEQRQALELDRLEKQHRDELDRLEKAITEE